MLFGQKANKAKHKSGDGPAAVQGSRPHSRAGWFYRIFMTCEWRGTRSIWTIFNLSILQWLEMVRRHSYSLCVVEFLEISI